MSKLKQLKLKYLAVAMAICLVSVLGFGVCKNILAAATVPAVTFDAKTDTITAKYGTTGYYFYTTSNASKKVPAANNWVRTENGAVDVSNFTKGKTLYFANSTTPELDEIISVTVPASPTISKAVYKAGAETIDGKFEFYTKIKVTEAGKTKTMAVLVPNTRIEIKVNDNSTWSAFATAITEATLEKLQKEGATIYARIAPSTKVTVKNVSGSNVYTFVDEGTTKITSAEAEKVYDSESITRYGLAKTLKITKKSIGPKVTIDYANHCMTIKNTQSYGKSSSAYVSPSSWTKPDATAKVYFGTNGTVKADEYYGIKTNGTAKAAESLVTYMVVPTTKTFADTDSTVTVQGGFGENATMVINCNSAENKKSVAYQYAIVDLSDTENFANLITSTGEFDYSNTKVKWSTVKTNANGVAKAALAWKKIEGKQIIVRKAAVKTEFSSAVEILNAPTGSGLATYSTAASMPEVDCWTKLTQAKYKTGFVGKNTGLEFCANIDSPIYNASTKKITFNVVGGKTVPNVSAITVKIGKKTYDASAAVTGVAANKAVTISSSKVTAFNYTVTIDLTKIEGFPESDANKVTIAVADGYGTNSASLTTVAKTLSITLDNKAPAVKSVKCTPASKSDPTTGNVVITVSSALTLGGTELKSGDTIAAANLTSSNTKAIVFTDASYKYNSKTKTATITVPYEAKNTTTEKVNITLKNLTDIAGNALSGNVQEITNPAYSNE